MKTIMEIAEMIALPEEVKERMHQLERSSDLESVLSEEAMRECIAKLTERDSWEQAWRAVKAAVAPDAGGFKMLFVMLQAAGRSYEKYRQCRISDDIFINTMKCFTRFIGEYQKIYGTYGFDRDFWVGRQLSLQLFRLGELEYEKVVEDGENAISIHIPSDAVISKENCRMSIEMALRFFKEQDEDYVDARYYCDSWLLSPTLKKLLPSNSRILQFQDLFEIQSVDETAKDGIYWIFKSDCKNPETLPEDTTLQRNAKQYLLAGGKIGSGKGILKRS